jgi:hypothetical protein
VTRLVQKTYPRGTIQEVSDANSAHIPLHESHQPHTTSLPLAVLQIQLGKCLGEKADIQPRRKGGGTGGKCQKLHKGPCTILTNPLSYTHICTGRYTYIPIPAYTRTYRHMRIFHIYKLHAYICTHVDMDTHTFNLSFNLCSIFC